ncbi:AbiH family protein [Flavobacterium mekongense]|uniref:AbiH family protein n=1 Tax=Flavobacterium mekongense TaxID=3379707 RepID=UPI00399B43E2
MNILFIIGNGFDINLGLQTSYKHFYKYYTSLRSEKDLIKILKKNIDSDFENWSDLELALGSYTDNFNTVNDFIEVYEDIGDNLAEYLISEEKKFPFNKIDKEKLFNYLSYPELSLLKADSNRVRNFKNTWPSEHWHVRIMSLNYTRSIENIFNNEYRKLIIGNHHNHSIILENIEHIHGFTDERMIMGVNDKSQIKNQSFHNSLDLLEALVKPYCNKAYKHTIDDVCVGHVQEAQLICVFGSSIGDTDNYWWQLIGEQLRKGCQLVIFTKGEEISRRWGYKKAQKEREMKDYFLNKTDLTDDEKLKFQNNIYVGVNTELFSGMLLP